MQQDALNVFLNESQVGTLLQENGALSFKYALEYLQNKEAYPLSQNLPLTDGIFHDPVVENFFSNLLPDERIRTTVAMILRVSPENTFGLLKHIGADCAGAVSFYPPGQTPQSARAPVYRELSDAEACHILDNLGQRPLDAGDEGVRISGAGSQEKLVACFRNGKIALPLYGTPSTHIIKPAIPNFPDSVFNEYFCMRLAKEVGLSASECDILFLNDECFYVVKRFDRKEEDGFTMRLHQEDFCQILNVPPKLKYQEDGGPGIEDCIQRMNEMHLPAVDRLRFIRLVIFNFLIGNCDAHAKNYAILYHGNKPSFAPAYDLLSTVIYESMSRRLAMNIGGESRSGMLHKEHFEQMAKDCGFHPKLILTELLDMASLLPAKAQNLTDELNEVHASHVYGRIMWEIGRLCRQIIN